MATQVTKFQSEDGQLFDTLAEAEKHEAFEALCAKLNDFYEYGEFDIRKAVEFLIENYELNPKGGEQ